MMPNRNHSGEMLYAVEMVGGRYIITGYVDRDTAHKTGAQHLSVIIVPFVVGSGKWLVHDRTAKLWAKGNPNPKTPSYNFWGGHCTADEKMQPMKTEITEELLNASAKLELSQEMLWNVDGIKWLEVWESGIKTDKSVSASQYPIGELIKIGYTTYKSNNNVEASFIYALPIPEEDVENLVAADNYMRDGEERDVWLPISVMDEVELKILVNNLEVEVCDAITRLWLPENESVYKKLRTVIADYRGACY